MPKLQSSWINDISSQNATQFKSVAAFAPPGQGEYFFKGQAQRCSEPAANQVSLYAPDFFLKDSEPWWIFSEVKELSTDTPIAGAEGELPLPIQLPEFDLFAEDFAKVQTAIQSGVLHKAVPVVLAKGKTPENFPQQAAMMYRNLKRQQSHGRALCFLSTPDSGLAGLSPELLFNWDFATNTLTTVALAGTGAGDPKMLLEDPKERKEHDLVVQGIVTALRDEGTMDIGETYVAPAGHLHHLKTEITCRLFHPNRNADRFMQLIRKLHPTPALGISSPQGKNKLDFHWLENLSSGPERLRFGAPFGIWDPMRGACIFVAIRNLQWTRDELILATGCGVIAESQLQSEWSEVSRKRQAVLKDLGATL